MKKNKILPLISDPNFTCLPPFSKDTKNVISVAISDFSAQEEETLSVQEYEKIKAKALEICNLLFENTPNALICESTKYEMRCGSPEDSEDSEENESGDEEEFINEMAKSLEAPITNIMVKMQFSMEYASPLRNNVRRVDLGVIKRSANGSMIVRGEREIYLIGKKECDPASLITWQIAGVAPCSAGFVSYKNQCVLTVTGINRCEILFADETAFENGKKLLAPFIYK